MLSHNFVQCSKKNLNDIFEKHFRFEKNINISRFPRGGNHALCFTYNLSVEWQGRETLGDGGVDNEGNDALKHAE